MGGVPFASSLTMEPMIERSTPHRSRRAFGRLLVFLAGLAPVAGCDCTGTLPVVPNPLPPLSALVVNPSSDTLRVGESHSFTAVAYDTLGQPLSGGGFSWTSNDVGVFTVDRSGRVIGVGDGLALLIVQAGGLRDTATVSVYPDTGWFVQTSHTARNLNGVFFLPDGRQGWSVGTAGVILHTVDAGANWAAQVSGTSATLNGVWFTDPLAGAAVGSNGTVLRTQDGGKVWTRQTLPSGENLMDVTFANSDTGWVVGSSGAVLRTVNGGVSWSKVNLTGPTLNGVSFSGTRDGWAVGDLGVIYGTHDTGLSWFLVQPGITSQSLQAVWRRSAAKAWAIGAQGVAPRTIVTPDSVAWELRNAGAANQLEGVHYPTDLIGYAVGYSGAGAILRTDNGGVSWQAQASHTSRRLNDVVFVDALRGWAVGEGGTIVHTARGGLR